MTLICVSHGHHSTPGVVTILPPREPLHSDHQFEFLLRVQSFIELEVGTLASASWERLCCRCHRHRIHCPPLANISSWDSAGRGWRNP
jgi:hypothetical protein